MSVVFIVMKRENILRKAIYFFLKIRDASENKKRFCQSYIHGINIEYIYLISVSLSLGIHKGFYYLQRILYI